MKTTFDQLNTQSLLNNLLNVSKFARYTNVRVFGVHNDGIYMYAYMYVSLLTIHYIVDMNET